MPVYEYSYPETYNEEQPAWFTMPKAQCFKLKDGVEIEHKLERMLEIAIILKKLHFQEKAHRDIKPDNILLYKGRMWLSDFGLVWVNEENSFTQTGERLGPFKIMPPELEGVMKLENVIIVNRMCIFGRKCCGCI